MLPGRQKVLDVDRFAAVEVCAAAEHDAAPSGGNASCPPVAPHRSAELHLAVTEEKVGHWRGLERDYAYAARVGQLDQLKVRILLTRRLRSGPPVPGVREVFDEIRARGSVVGRSLFRAVVRVEHLHAEQIDVGRLQ